MQTKILSIDIKITYQDILSRHLIETSYQDFILIQLLKTSYLVKLISLNFRDTTANDSIKKAIDQRNTRDVCDETTC